MCKELYIFSCRICCATYYKIGMTLSFGTHSLKHCGYSETLPERRTIDVNRLSAQRMTSNICLQPTGYAGG